MSINLSDVIPKPYLGVSAIGQTLSYLRPNPVFQLTSTDTTISGDGYPSIILTNSYAAVGSGGVFYFQSKNNAAAYKNSAFLKGSLTDITAASEKGKLTLAVADASAMVSISYQNLAGVFQFGPDDPSKNVMLGNPTGGSFQKLFLGNATNPAFSIDPSIASTVTRISVAAGTLQLSAVSSAVSQVNIGAGWMELNPASIGLGATSVLYLGASRYGADAQTLWIDGKYTFTGGGIARGLKMDLTVLGTGAPADVVGADLSSVVNSSSSTITNVYGFRVSAGTGIGTVLNYGFCGLLAANAAKTWNLYMPGTAPNYMAGVVTIGNTAVVARMLSVESTVATTAVARFINSNSTPTSNILAVASGGNASGHNLVDLSNSTNADVMRVRGDGIILVNTATQLNTARMTVKGRLSILSEDLYDYNSNTTSITMYIEGARNIVDTKTAYGAYFLETVDMAGTSNYFGYSGSANVNSSASASIAYGMQGFVVNKGAGLSIGLHGYAAGGFGHTGALVGMRCEVFAAPTTAGLVTGNLIVLRNRADYGIRIDGNGTGQNVGIGVLVDSSAYLTGASFQYNQRATSTASLIKYVDNLGNTRFEVDYNGDVNIGGFGRRIKGDFSDATTANRVAFQSSVTNGSSIVTLIPNGTGSQAGMGGYNTSDPANASRLLSYITATSAFIWSSPTGSGALVPLALSVGSAQVISLTVQTNNDMTLGTHAGITTASTSGFPYLLSVAGVMTGVPSVRTGFTPVVIDTTNSKIGAYIGGAWKWTAALT